MRYSTLLLVLASAPASAMLITVDAADYSRGTGISTLSRGADFFTYTNYGPSGVRVEPVIIVPNRPGWGADIAPNAFGHSSLTGTDQLSSFRNVREAERCLLRDDCEIFTPGDQFFTLLVSFDTPTDYVALDAHFDANAIDGSRLRAYDAAGNLLGVCAVKGAVQTVPQAPGGCSTQYRRYNCDTETECATDTFAYISLPNASISFVLYGGEAANATGSTITSLTYNAIGVPEPASLGLLAFGGLLAVTTRRRRGVAAT